jgi:hypothetical protein
VPSSATETLAAIDRFLKKAAQPVLLEPGEREVSLITDSYSLELSAGQVRIHAWADERTYTRHITGIRAEQPHSLELTFRRLGRPSGVLRIVDAGHGRSVELRRRGARELHREGFRLALARQFPDWKVEQITTGADLEHSLSPAYPRAALRRGTSLLAAILAPADSASGPDGVLTFGLIWLDYLRRRESKRVVESLAIFVPEPKARNTALRLRWLDSSRIDVQLFLFAEAGETRVDPRDWGNIETRLMAPPAHPAVRIGQPEGDLEIAVRNSITAIDAALLSDPVYRQAPAMAAADRGIMDLVAVDREGRLAVLELKATQDIQMPLQALDYWMRVRWHLDCGDFSRLGYFPNVPLSTRAPFLYLVAPALEFHPAHDTVLQFLERTVPVVRVGLGANWKKELKVIFRQEHHERFRSTS